MSDITTRLQLSPDAGYVGHELMVPERHDYRPMEDRMQHFHEFYRRVMAEHLY